MFKENEHGVWIVHAYQFKQGCSTFVLETTPEAFARSGLTVQDEQATVAYVQKLFNQELKGYKVLTNRSHWRRFPKVHCAHWHHENIVLIGDAAHTAHFSIGSGTKLALEDAMSLAQSLANGWHNVPAALATYERDRRPRSERIQAAAVISLEWFENIQRHWHLPPLQFNFSLLTRSNQITYDNMKLRDASFVTAVTNSLADSHDVVVEPALASLQLGKIILPHRMVELNDDADASMGLFLISAVGDKCIASSVAGELPGDSLLPQRIAELQTAISNVRQYVGENVEIGLRLASTVAADEAIAFVRAAQSVGCAVVHIVHDSDTGLSLEPLILCETLRGETGIAVLLSGLLESRDAGNTAIASGRVDLVALKP